MRLTKSVRLLAPLLLCLISACGGGGGGSGSTAVNAPVATPPPTAPTAPAPAPSAADLNAASRLAARATFGLPYVDIVNLAREDAATWIDQQLSLPVTLQQPLVEDLLRRRAAGEFDGIEEDVELLISFRRYAWWHHAMTAPDQLRARVSYALSQLFVVSDNVDVLIIYPQALSNYADTLATHAFGNFRDLLRAVALHPAMGIYLSHVNNRRANPAANTFPDENFAREIMQLFSIGLYELNPDGTRKLDAQGQPIATYGNAEIREFAKIFTGLSFAGPGAFFGQQEPNFDAPMQMFEAFHEPGSKTLLNGVTVPAGLSGLEDIDAAIDNLFMHPNVGPFVATRLIQRLVSSNPSPAYVERISRVFNGEASGVRGDMAAVIRAILLDEEALQSPQPLLNRGKLREPVLRYLTMLRALNASSTDGFFFNSGFFLQQLVGQHPLSAPSVFNFYLPDHTPSGEIADASLVAPEFQITNTTTVVGITNLVDIVVNADFVMDAQPPFGQVSLDLTEFEALAADPDALLDRLDLLFCHGTLDPATRAAIRAVLVDIADLPFRTRTAIYLVLTSPDAAVEI